MSRLSLEAPLRIHVIGIAGAGMSPLATVLQSMGHRVRGSDLRDGPGAERLRALGVDVFVGHDAEHLGDAEAVVISSAVQASNLELAAARQRAIPVYSRADTLAALTELRRTVAVSGTHGKTTTSSMLAVVLGHVGWSPSYVIGGDPNSPGANAAWSTGEWLVVEADESDGTFLELDSDLAVVTSLEPDHLDHYGNVQALEDAFVSFVNGARLGAVVLGDEPILVQRAAGRALTYGFSPEADVVLSSLRGGRSDVAFSLSRSGELLGELELPVPGAHNALNATAACSAAMQLGIAFGEVQGALAGFAGVARRFEFRGEARGVTFVDDYAHLPGEVSAILAAARRGGWKRIVCVFQPHRYSRIAALAADFASSFVDADLVLVSSIYPAGEQPRPGVSSRLVVDAVEAAHPKSAIAYVPGRSELAETLRATLRPGDLCLTLGAGDLTSLPDELLGEATW